MAEREIFQSWMFEVCCYEICNRFPLFIENKDACRSCILRDIGTWTVWLSCFDDVDDYMFKQWINLSGLVVYSFDFSDIKHFKRLKAMVQEQGESLKLPNDEISKVKKLLDTMIVLVHYKNSDIRKSRRCMQDSSVLYPDLLNRLLNEDPSSTIPDELQVDNLQTFLVSYVDNVMKRLRRPLAYKLINNVLAKSENKEKRDREVLNNPGSSDMHHRALSGEEQSQSLLKRNDNDTAVDEMEVDEEFVFPTMKVVSQTYRKRKYSNADLTDIVANETDAADDDDDADAANAETQMELPDSQIVVSQTPERLESPKMEITKSSKIRTSTRRSPRKTPVKVLINQYSKIDRVQMSPKFTRSPSGNVCKASRMLTRPFHNEDTPDTSKNKTDPSVSDLQAPILHSDNKETCEKDLSKKNDEKAVTSTTRSAKKVNKAVVSGSNDINDVNSYVLISPVSNNNTKAQKEIENKENSDFEESLSWDSVEDLNLNDLSPKPKNKSARRMSSASVASSSVSHVRVKFTEDEERNLMKGVKRYGVGNWVKILRHYNFHPSRTNVSLKDKYRNMKRHDLDLVFS